MPLSSNSAIAFPTVPIPVPSIPRRQANCRKFSIKCSNENFSGQRIITFSPYRRKRSCLTNSVSSDGNNSINVDVPFPSDYSELLDQAKMAAELAVKDGRKLMEIEFPTAGLDSVPGNGEGGIEMTGSMRLICEFCDLFVTPEKVTRTRIEFIFVQKGTRKRGYLLYPKPPFSSKGRIGPKSPIQSLMTFISWTSEHLQQIWSSVEKDAKAMRLPAEDLPFGKFDESHQWNRQTK
ncbi:hypothetical protein CUMW_115460 [Citrus unshiu]|nr:hypothetical protein CUMW_115460 [Citrus unshiu]